MHKTKVILLVIFLVSFFFRFIDLEKYPPSLNWDEVSLGYNAYSMVKTGQDEWGIRFPTLFRAFGDYKLPGYIYFDALPIFALGLSTLSVRLPSVIAGWLLIPVTFVLVRTLKRSLWESLWITVLVSFSPWTLFLSRVAVEANLALLFVSLGVALLLRNKSTSGLLFLGLSVWTYNSARIFVPLIMLVLLLLNIKKIRFSLKPTFLIIMFFIPMFMQLYSPVGQARFKWLSLLDPSAIGAIEQLRNNSNLPDQLDRVIYNRPVYFVYKFTSNFLSYFSPNFLFLHGGSHYQFSLPGHGLLFGLFLPLFYLGLAVLFKDSINKNKSSIFILGWLILAAIPGSIVKDAPHPLRAIFMSLPVYFITIVGLSKAYSVLVHKVVYKVFVIGVCTSFILSIFSYLNYSTHYSWAWQHGYQQLVEYSKKHYSEYDEIIITKRYGEPHEFILFYWPWNPTTYINNPNLNRYFRSDWFWVDGFDKFKFVNDWGMQEYSKSLDPNKKYLIFSSPDYQLSATDLFTINFLDGKPAFYVKEL